VNVFDNLKIAVEKGFKQGEFSSLIDELLKIKMLSSFREIAFLKN
jgi:hypothetical protein